MQEIIYLKMVCYFWEILIKPVRKTEDVGGLYGKAMTNMSNITTIKNLNIKAGVYIPPYNPPYERVTLENQYQISIDDPIGIQSSNRKLT